MKEAEDNGSNLNPENFSTADKRSGYRLYTPPSPTIPDVPCAFSPAFLFLRRFFSN